MKIAQEITAALTARIDANLEETRKKNERWLKNHVEMLDDDNQLDYGRLLLDIAAEALTVYAQYNAERGIE
jgi:hypothetical protein